MTCDGAIGNSRKLLFLGAVGCSCCSGRLVTFWEVVFYHKKEIQVTTGNGRRTTERYIIRYRYLKTTLISDFSFRGRHFSHWSTLFHDECSMFSAEAHPAVKDQDCEGDNTADRHTGSKLWNSHQGSAGGAWVWGQRTLSAQGVGSNTFTGSHKFTVDQTENRALSQCPPWRRKIPKRFIQEETLGHVHPTSGGLQTWDGWEASALRSLAGVNR